MSKHLVTNKYRRKKPASFSILSTLRSAINQHSSFVIIHIVFHISTENSFHQASLFFISPETSSREFFDEIQSQTDALHYWQGEWHRDIFQSYLYRQEDLSVGDGYP